MRWKRAGGGRAKFRRRNRRVFPTFPSVRLARKKHGQPSADSRTCHTRGASRCCVNPCGHRAGAAIFPPQNARLMGTHLPSTRQNPPAERPSGSNATSSTASFLRCIKSTSIPSSLRAQSAYTPACGHMIRSNKWIGKAQPLPAAGMEDCPSDAASRRSTVMQLPSLPPAHALHESRSPAAAHRGYIRKPAAECAESAAEQLIGDRRANPPQSGINFRGRPPPAASRLQLILGSRTDRQPRAVIKQISSE